jgi:hypothetical protein
MSVSQEIGTPIVQVEHISKRIGSKTIIDGRTDVDFGGGYPSWRVFDSHAF